MIAAVQWLAGLALALAGWRATRKVAGAKGGPLGALALDGAVPVLGFLLLSAATARPVFAGIVILALIGGLAFADYAKRAILKDPVVFTDLSELIELFRHPGLYLPYAGPVRIVAGALAALVVAGLLFWLEPPAFSASWVLTAAAVLAAATLIVLPASLMLQPAARLLGRLSPSGDPERDAAEFGLMAMLLTHGIIARAERNARRAALAPPIAPPSRPASPAPPVVLVQSESFFDVRRLGEALFPGALGAFDAARGEAVWGRLKTPAFGANTVRTEFEAITGIEGRALGFDRFNPYHAFVRRPVGSLAWAMKARGYRTVCLHPFDRRFYARHRVMAHLGFDDFIGAEAFPAPPNGGYVSDAVLAERIEALLSEAREPLFVFAITMENHGPWDGGLGGLADPAPALPPIPQGSGLKTFAARLAGADEMIARLTGALSSGGVLGFYGDHLPSLPAAFEALGFSEDAADYLVWRKGLASQRRDISAHELAQAVLAALDEGRGGRP